ncbi:solute:Na+ symporter, SSS family [Thermanaeromonas toyohensis ToBE]|uniref:Solute:Na+ symporter, SSS family n=1 Tax=Thermanaeromonas toyohensis ToBE TaxID=698762 RepID=A0A1W1VVY1_9FIRM|nr:sodium:solute symporter family protein [Thermanaeromonas toyohensis]SMB97527.1 solute:Na+ symporter, SSS family [Thermanaeromonas toyohensis ToBE]
MGYDLTAKHVVAAVLTLIGVALVGKYAGRHIRGSADFLVGGHKANALIVAGTIVGTLVGGASTIGTAQMAYLYGFAAWWFTLGAGIGCLFLALFFVKPLYQGQKDTVPEILMAEFGPVSGTVSTIFVSLGIFLNIVAQVLSAIALLTTMFKISPLPAAFLSLLLMAFYVAFGGIWGTGLVGIVKLFLIYIAMLSAGLMAWMWGGGWAGYQASFPAYPYFSFFGRGFWQDFASGFSLIIGVLSTQTYIQAVVAGKSLNHARLGAILSAMLIPPIGLAGIFVGLYMRIHFPAIDSAAAFPLFILTHINPWLGGVILATLLIAVVGTGAGLTLGISTILVKDIYKLYLDKKASDVTLLKACRFMILVILALTLLFITGNIKSLVLKWSFMSMGLRGVTVFLPLCVALFAKGKVDRKAAVISMVLAPLSMLAGKFFLRVDLDPLFLGVLVSFLIISCGYVIHRISYLSKRNT